MDERAVRAEMSNGGKGFAAPSLETQDCGLDSSQYHRFESAVTTQTQRTLKALYPGRNAFEDEPLASPVQLLLSVHAKANNSVKVIRV
jgi:hypothetical protein